MRTLRGKALTKLACLSAASPTTNGSEDDFRRLCEACPTTRGHSDALNNGTPARGPEDRLLMDPADIEILIALCQSSRSIKSVFEANRLLQQVSVYAAECSRNLCARSVGRRKFRPAPWELLSFSLFSAVLSIGSNHPSLRDTASAVLNAYLDNCSQSASHILKVRGLGGDSDADLSGQHYLEIVTLMTSVLGFLEASTRENGFLNVQEQYGVVRVLQRILSEELLTTFEASLARLRTSRSQDPEIREIKYYLKSYAEDGRPLGSMLVRYKQMKLLTAFASSSLHIEPALRNQHLLDRLMSSHNPRPKVSHIAEELLLETVTEVVNQQILNIEENSDYLRMGSSWQQELVHAMKAECLVSFLCCFLRNDDVADVETLMTWLESSLADSVQMTDTTLSGTVLKCMTVVAKTSTQIASNLSRSFARFLTSSARTPQTAAVVSQCLLCILRLLPQDTVITTLYGLGNSLSSRSTTETSGTYALFNDQSIAAQRNMLSNHGNNFEDSSDTAENEIEKSSNTYSQVIDAVVVVSRGYDDEKITGLALSMLVQKVGKISPAVDMKIITEAARLGISSAPSEFKALLRLFNKLTDKRTTKDAHDMIQTVSYARDYLSRTLEAGSELFEVYLEHLLETIIGKGDVTRADSTSRQKNDIENAAQEIEILLRPLAILAANNASKLQDTDFEVFPALQRDAWYNIVVHEFSIRSQIGLKHLDELKILAKYSRALVVEDSADRSENDVELNTVLRRCMSSESTARHKRELSDLLPQCESEIKSLSYPELMFLKAVHLVETLRAEAGDCTVGLKYFTDPQLREGELGKIIALVVTSAVELYLRKTLRGNLEAFSAPFVAQQLARMFEGCCNRVFRVQEVAYSCAENMITQVPSALCQRSSLFALLDLLSMLWASCLESETEEYEWRSTYISFSGSATVQLSDDFTFRNYTLKNFHRKARLWVIKVLNIAPLDIKGLFQTYLSEYGDDETFGHMSLGRSFAFEMGAMIPESDQRLGAIDMEEGLNINTASDFMAQYTHRQEYRFSEPFSLALDKQAKIASGLRSGEAATGFESDEPVITSALMELDRKLTNGASVSLEETKDILRHAAMILCRSNSACNQIVSLFVKIPFISLRKHIVKVGLSLWMGVIKENTRMQPRILVEVIENWIRTVRDGRGLFDRFRMKHQDPFFLKEEFAPSDRESILKRQQHTHDALVPHFRILQFLSSHYAATRLTNTCVERAFYRLFRITLRGLRETSCHPLAREAHFHIVLLGLRILRHCTSLDSVALWYLKDEILSAALSWFSHAPQWSYGGNRLQVKAETHLLADVSQALQNVKGHGIFESTTLRSLHLKQQLLEALLSSEQTRLVVWLFPLDHAKKHHFSRNPSGYAIPESSVVALTKVAWIENPAIALNLPSRFRIANLQSTLRTILLEQPQKALDEPEALQTMLGPSLPGDVSSQLKFLLYWTAVNPITAVTYFLPAYRNHPLLVQYAVRALESHSVDVTFFYVPQIVQTLRYDALGYVERYIVETGTFSPLFAHQIIWNIKANAYKDEEGTEPDDVKPTLDRVMGNLVQGFTVQDKNFYEREFSFFNEVTSISGKLRPFIKKSKQEKKQKIEEELRQIQVQVGVYLPSNPDGVVVGIDRKSGKPLQSHAKAPFMATFRIRKTISGEEENGEDVLAQDQIATADTYEIWQSAIFKVGDDCRQDVLALQMIAAFRGIFHSVGLPVYVFPYRVTATAPGCGVIDVLPASVSRDMMGRESVNGLYDWFRGKFGGEDAPAFQVARANFVKSLAAYSIISYLLQFKDRHNGNIMFDEQGHILHIDFGFCFDIAPGGVKFERAPFKLTKEMVAVMGGSTSTQSFRWFEELCVKAFLACRPYMEPLSHIVVTMLDSGLPCFKPETINHFRDRFVIDKSERDAAQFVRYLVSRSCESLSTKGYDSFQLLTNGIPY